MRCEECGKFKLFAKLCNACVRELDDQYPSENSSGKKSKKRPFNHIFMASKTITRSSSHTTVSVTENGVEKKVILSEDFDEDLLKHISDEAGFDVQGLMDTFDMPDVFGDISKLNVHTDDKDDVLELVKCVQCSTHHIKRAKCCPNCGFSG